MKYCAQCQQKYADETLNFCLSDGSSLLTTENPSIEETVVKPLFIAPPIQIIKQGVSPIFAYLIVGLLALIAGGAIVALLKSDSNGLINDNNIALSNKFNETNTPIENSSANRNMVPIRTPVPDGNVLIESEAKSALDRWVQTLIDHNLEQHLSYYADQLDFYNKKRNADISYVRDVNLKLFNKYSQFRLEIRNVKTNVTTNGQVITTFESVYDFRGNNAVHSGLDRGTEIRWKRIDGIWKIVSER
jgi:hypothetical protein